MTLDAAMPISGAAGDAAPDAGPSRGSRSLARQAAVDTVARPGARFGMFWIGLLVLAAVFSPFIASSFPLLVREHGKVWSPALHQLTPADICWLVGFIATCALAISRKVTFGTAMLTIVWTIAVAIPLTVWPQIVD